MTDYDDQNSSEYKDHEPRKQLRQDRSGQQISSPADVDRIQIRQSAGQSAECHLRITDRILTGRIHRITGQIPPQNQLDRILTGRIHRMTDRSHLRINWTESLLAESAEQRTDPTSEQRTESLLAEPNITSRFLLRTTDRILAGRTANIPAESLLSITGSRPTGRTSRSARDVKRTPSQRSP